MEEVTVVERLMSAGEHCQQRRGVTEHVFSVGIFFSATGYFLLAFFLLLHMDVERSLPGFF